MSPPIPESIALVDFFHMLTVNFKAYAAAPTDDARPNAAGFRTLEQLAAVRTSCGHVVVCMDSPPYWRKKLYPDYKGKRAEREPEWKAVVDWTLERVRLGGYNIAQATGEEADDVAATLARVYSQEYGCTDVRIVGADCSACAKRCAASCRRNAENSTSAAPSG
jgi:5'-3' exonuclease